MQTAHSLWLLGYPDQALASIQASLALAQQIAHPLSLTIALRWAAVVHYLRRVAVQTQARAETAMTIATDQGFAEQVALVTPLRDWTLAANSQGEQGRAQSHQGLATYQATEVTRNRSDRLALLAETFAQAGQITQGFGVPRRGVGYGGQEPGTLVGSGAVSAQERTAVATDSHTAGGGRSLLPAGPGHGPSPVGQVVGAAYGDEPEPPVAVAGQAGRSS